MIDITSVTAGLFVGSCFGFLVAAVVNSGKIMGLIEENERLNRELSRLTDRDTRGRFKGGNK